jgi:hypothetical protein
VILIVFLFLLIPSVCWAFPFPSSSDISLCLSVSLLHASMSACSSFASRHPPARLFARLLQMTSATNKPLIASWRTRSWTGYLEHRTVSTGFFAKPYL